MKLFIASILLLSQAALGASKTPKIPIHIECHTRYHFINNKADKVAGASYGRKYSNGISVNLSVGVELLGGTFINVSYDYWYAGRRYTLDESVRRDTLNYQNLGGELGILWHINPRLYWLVALGAYYPLTASVMDGETRYQNTNPLSFQGRFSVGFNLTAALAFHMEGGYRTANLGDLTNSGVSLLEDGGNFDLSGAFFGLGFVIGL